MRVSSKNHETSSKSISQHNFDNVVLILVGMGFIREGPKHIPVFAAYTAGGVLILLTIFLVVWLVRNR